MKSMFLDEVLVKHDPQAVVSLFHGANESYRKSVAQRAIDWFRVSQYAARIKRNSWLANPMFADSLSAREKRNLTDLKALQQELPRQANDADGLEAAKVAMLAACSMTEIKKYGASCLPQAKNCRQVLENRKPKWLAKWMEFASAERPLTHWKLVRGMELDGLATAERDSGYWRAMVLSLAESEASLVESLKVDSELLEHHIWGILDDEPTMSILSNPFETENWLRIFRNADDDPEYFRALAVRRTTAHKAWHHTFIDIARNDLIDKERFKSRLLYWITRIGSDDQMKDAPSYMKMSSRIEWFVEIFDAIPFSEQEKAELIPNLTGMISSKNSDVLKWAVARLTAYPPEVVPVDDLSINLGSLFRIKGKEHAIDAIKLMKSLIEARPNDRVKLACALTAGLEHPSQDVQRRVLDLIEKQKLADDKDVVSELRYRSYGLTGLLRERAEKLMSESANAQSTTNVRSTTDVQSAKRLKSTKSSQSGTSSQSRTSWQSGTSWQSADDAEFEELKKSQETFNDNIRDVTDLNDALKAVEGAVPYTTALRLRAYDVPRLDAANVIAPITDIDDLTYRFLHILESDADWESIELCLDGLSRLASQTPSDLPARLAPLKQRATDKIKPDGSAVGSAPFAGYNHITDLAAVCIAWTDRWVIEPQTGFNNPLVGIANMVTGGTRLVQFRAPWGSWTSYGRYDTSSATFICKRLLALAHRVAKKSSLPMLAAPTHKGGWIDPTELVRKLIVWNESKQTPDSFDFIQALLRLAPDCRKEALDGSQSLRGEMFDALRYALGGDLSSNMSKAEWWVAAARARSPLETFDVLTHRFPGLGPDTTVKAKYNESVESLAKLDRYAYPAQNSPQIFAVSPSYKKRDNAYLFPTELLHCASDWYAPSNPEAQGLWLQDRESYFAAEARRQAMNLESASGFWKRSWEPIFDQDTSACGFAKWMIAIGLSSKQPDNARSALDALIACIDDCRLDGVIFGDTLAELIPTGRVTLARWVRAFKDCARVSPLHLQVTRLAVERCLGQAPKSDDSEVSTPAKEASTPIKEASTSAKEASTPAKEASTPAKEASTPAKEASTPAKEASTPIKLIELLYDLCMESGETITAPKTRAYLESLGTKGKSGKLAQSLLSLPVGSADAHRKAAAMQALRQRISRAERYSRTAGA